MVAGSSFPEGTATGANEPAEAVLSAAEIASWRDRLAAGVVDGLSPAGLVALVRAAEELAAAAAGVQAVATAALAAASPRTERRTLTAHVGLARKVSPYRAASHVRLAETLATGLPHTLAALRAGQLSEYRARLIAQETVWLSANHRQVVDAHMCADPSGMEGWGDRRVANEARKIAYRLDPHTAVARASHAAADRFVSIRPAPDTMVRLTALLPVVSGVATFAALNSAAEQARCAGDERKRAQIMADELVARVTGATGEGQEGARRGFVERSTADTAPRRQETLSTAGPGASSLVINLVMTDRTLLAGDCEPAHLDGYGIVPADWARAMVADRLEHVQADETTNVMIRRLFTAPVTGALVGMESRARHAPSALRRLIMFRDHTCRIPWCDAAIRHIDHLARWEDGGTTSEAGIAGLCEAHNYVHEHADWHHVPEEGPPLGRRRSRQTFTVITPTGHAYRSVAPPLPGTVG